MKLDINISRILSKKFISMIIMIFIINIFLAKNAKMNSLQESKYKNPQDGSQVCDVCNKKIIPDEDLEEKIPNTEKTGKITDKFLFMYKYAGVKNKPNHKLNIFTYKNFVMKNSQLVVFESPNENDPVK